MATNKRLIKSNDEGGGGASFNTVLWDGDNTANRAIGGVGFQPDFVWIKIRNVVNFHHLFDSIRGAGYNLFSNAVDADSYVANTLQSFNSDGFTVNQNGNVNGSGYNLVAWCWKAAGYANTFNVLENGSTTSSATAAGVGLGTGTNLSSYSISANRDAGFSIINYSPNGTPEIVPHGLNKKPQLVLTKSQSISSDWYCLTDLIDGSIDWVFLNTSGAAVNTSDTLTDTTFSTAWGSGNIISYAFHSVDGYQKVGSYSGGLSGSSNVIETGFKPRFLLVKRTDIAGDAWQMFDSIRGGGDTFDNYVQANTSAAEVSYNQREVNFTTNGFYWTFAESGTNISGGTYIYLAIA